jgi:hypothetical protein
MVAVSACESTGEMGSHDGNENVGTRREFDTAGDKLTIMMRDRTQAINNIRSLLESDGKRGKSRHHVDHFILSFCLAINHSLQSLHRDQCRLWAQQ